MAKPVASIVVGERRRKDMGDLNELARSLAQCGLIQPIVIDDDGRLVAGGRRLAAAKLLGWQEIDCRLFGALSDVERREIELEENIRRKDLLPGERDELIMRLGQVAAEADREAFVKTVDDGANSVKSVDAIPPRGRGHPERPGSLRRTAARIGMSQENLRRAQQAAISRVCHDLPIETAREDAIAYDLAVRADPSQAGRPATGMAKERRDARRRATVPEQREERGGQVTVAESELGTGRPPEGGAESAPPTTGEKISRARRRGEFFAAVDAIRKATGRIEPETLPACLLRTDWGAVDTLVWELGEWSGRLAVVRKQQGGNAS